VLDMSAASVTQLLDGYKHAVAAAEQSAPVRDASAAGVARVIPVSAVR
jgi:hypothetical protein